MQVTLKYSKHQLTVHEIAVENLIVITSSVRLS